MSTPNGSSLRIALAGGFALVIVGFTFAQDRFPDSLPTRPPPGGQAPANNNGNPPGNRAAPVPQFPPSSNSPGSNTAGPARETAPASGNADPKFAAAAAVETKDFGVAPMRELRGDPMHAPTPTQIPGGATISTEALHAMTQQKESPFILLDVLGGERGLPGAQNAYPAGNHGTFADSTQRELGNYLQQVTQGKRDVALIFYCQSNHCWRSYNAALRAIQLGYSRVYWYRGGIEAWTQAGLPTFARQ
jgi:PQQ-dependent catabolism-associated CXXCW motif protein